MRRAKLPAAAAVCAMMLPAAAWAQDDAVPPSTEGAAVQGKNSYVPGDFARFAPRNALDMLSRVPGFSIRSDDAARGLGEASSNVLINGERIANKSESTFDRLARIPTDKVERIEIVDASSFAIPGLAGQVANVVTKAGGISGRFEWRGAVRPHFAHKNFYGGEVSLSGTAGKLDYTLALSNNNGRGAVGGPYTIRDGNDALLEGRDMVLTVDNENPRVAATLKWDGPGSSVGNFHGNYHRFYFDLARHEDRDVVSGADNFWAYDAHNRGYDYEIGGDFEFALGPGRLKLIGLTSGSHGFYHETAISDYVDLTPSDGSRFEQLTDTGETIARGEYGWKMLGGDWQLAGEAAFNSLDRVSHLLFLNPAGTFDDFPYPGSSGGVTEDRYEVILTHTRQLAPNLSLQIGGGGEYSRLSQTGSNGLVRKFQRPKGSLTLSWTPKKGLDLSFRLARKVGQLSFGDFLARVFLDNGNQNAGNNALVPTQSWEAELEIKKDFGGWGSATLKPYARWYEDYIDVIPLPGANPGELVELTGNIDRARAYGANLNGTLNLDPIGFRGAKFDIGAYFEHTSIKDPLTGITRAWSYEYDRGFNIGFRHDIPGSNWAWGGGIQYDHVLPYYRLAEVGTDHEGPIYTRAFIENKNVFGLTVNFNVFNLNNGRGLYDRIVYDGRRDTGAILFKEHRNQLVGPIFQFSVKGTF